MCDRLGGEGDDRDIGEHAQLPAGVKRLLTNRRFETPSAAESDQSVVDAGRELAGKQHELLAFESADVDRLLDGETMCGRQQDGDPFAANRLVDQVARYLWAKCDGELDRAAAERADHAGVPDLLRQQLDLGSLRTKRAPERGKRLEADAPAEADPQGSELTCPGAARRGERTFGLGERTPRALEQHLACLGQRDLAARPQEELDPELRVELPDRDAERRLSRPQPSGGAAEVAVISGGNAI